MPKDYFDSETRESSAEGEKRGEESVIGIRKNIQQGQRPEEPYRMNERSIRNIPVSQRRVSRVGSGDVRLPEDPWRGGGPKLPEKKSRPAVLWGIAAFATLLLVILGLFAFRPTSVTVTPTSEALTFDSVRTFTIYPAGAGEGAPTFTVSRNEFEESAVVASGGTETVSEKATGSVTLYNAHSATPIRLIKNTRVENPDGLIFRIPNEVIVPGKKGSQPGSVSVSVSAERAGEKYNIGPERFNLPGLKGSSMYANVYARSTSSMSGGFEGTRPVVDASELASKRAELRSRLEEKARDSANTPGDDTSVVLSDLTRITYKGQNLNADDGKVRVIEKATVEVPVIPAHEFADYIAREFGIDTGGAIVRVERLDGLTAKVASSSETLDMDKPISFTLEGEGLLVWDVNEDDVAKALAGKHESDFERTIAGLPEISEARARIQPFWKSTFPTNAAKIRIKLAEPRPQP